MPPVQAQSAAQFAQFSPEPQLPSPHPTHTPLALQVRLPEQVPQVPPQEFEPQVLPLHCGVQQLPL